MKKKRKVRYILRGGDDFYIRVNGNIIIIISNNFRHLYLSPSVLPVQVKWKSNLWSPSLSPPLSQKSGPSSR